MTTLQVTLSTLLPVLKLQQFTHPMGAFFLGLQQLWYCTDICPHKRVLLVMPGQ